MKLSFGLYFVPSDARFPELQRASLPLPPPGLYSKPTGGGGWGGGVDSALQTPSCIGQ